ncbi:MAG TPA: dUTP diphosphatase [Pseudomonadales bacterium]|nr:dUTP diphosphatase [Pseudomonadales bacterium]
MLQQLTTMLEMQDRMNRKVHPDWINQQFAWYRALWIECGELIEHYGYKWWKHQQPAWEHVKLEIVDIWHFGMSMRFDGTSTPAQIAAGMLEELRLAPPQTMELREAVEALAGRALVGREFPVGHFWSLLQAAGMTPDELFTAYVGKNVLNFFRQDHGYKDGSYRKTWQGREDNEHLAELLGQLDSRSPRYADELYGALAARYAQAAAANA